MAEVCAQVWRGISLPTRILCVVILVLQASIINFYLVRYISQKHLGWIAADIVVLTVFITAFTISYRHLRLASVSANEGARVRPGALPLGYLTWLIYSAFLVSRIAIAFIMFSWKLNEKDVWGPNILKISITLTAPIFLLFLLTHHDAPTKSQQKQYISEITSGVTFDIFDSIDILDVLYLEQSKLVLPYSLEKSILTIACINLILPVIPLIVLSRSHFGHQHLSETLIDIYKLLQMAVVNVPFLVIRLILWNAYSKNVSIFTMKNILSIFLTLHGIHEKKVDKQNENTESSNHENIILGRFEPAPQN